MILIANLVMWWLVWDWPTFVLLLPATLCLDTLLTWALYLDVMGLQDARDDGRLHHDMVTPAVILLGIGLFQDFFYNQTWGAVIFFGWCGWKVTDRLKHYRYSADVWAYRVRLTEWFAIRWLDPFDRHHKWKHV